MRWHFTLWNQTATNTEFAVDMGAGTYVVDQNGNRSKFLAHKTDFGRLLSGVKTDYSIDFEEPFPGAKTLTGYFDNKGTIRGLPTTVVPLTTGIETPPPYPTPRPSPKFAGQRDALLVGIRKYRLTESAKDDEPFPNLMYSEKDVVDLADAMKKAGYQESNIVLMTGERGEKDSALKPEPRNVLNKLSQLAGKCTDQDVLVVGFAGHGFQKSDHRARDGPSSIIAAPGAKLEGRDDALIDIDDVYKVLGDSRAGFKLLIVDACRNNASPASPPIMKPGFASVSAGSVPPGVLALFSCKEGQRSYESDALRNGVFFHFVIEAFQGKANPSNGQLMRHDLDKHLTEHVDQYVHDVLKLDEHQLWQFRGESDRNLPLADVPGRAKLDTNEPGTLELEIPKLWDNRRISSYSWTGRSTKCFRHESASKPTC